MAALWMLFAGGAVYEITFEMHAIPQWVGVVALLVALNVMVRDIFVDTGDGKGFGLIEKTLDGLAKRIGETEAERLARHIEEKPSDLDELVSLGQLLKEEDRKWVTEHLKQATAKHNA
jgi:hypothetical protein